MKYKKGDKVRIKTWKEMEKEYGCSKAIGGKAINCKPHCFLSLIEKDINKSFPNRILTIKKTVRDNRYIMEKIDPEWNWTDCMIEGLFIPEPISLFSTNKRFELMDLE